MQTMTSLSDLLSRVRVFDCWKDPLSLKLGCFDRDHPFLQVVCHRGNCTIAGMPLVWRGRKWVLSLHMTDAEVVSTAWMAVQAAVLHELRELFRFDGAAIYDGHHGLEELKALALTPRDSREPPKGLSWTPGRRETPQSLYDKGPRP